MCILNRRLQVLIDDDQMHRLEREATRQRVAVSVLVREAIDAAFPANTAVRRAAGRQVLEAEPMPVPDVAELVDELNDLRARRR